ncbi:MAG: chorismate synthase [Deltaproteobacteria bacterium]|nr:MAG: chorismate synthase [Deltaproteobacteria bacterium]
MFRFITAGESHGQALIAIVEGLPAGLEISEEFVNRELVRRQRGYGRGSRMRIEKDRAEILSGVRWGKSIGSPIAIRIENRDWKNWQEMMAVYPLESTILKKQEKKGLRRLTRPRPGHADLAGALKFGHQDLRNVLERASARETAARTAVGAIAKKFLEEFDIVILSWVTEIGDVKIKRIGRQKQKKDKKTQDLGYFKKLFDRAERSVLRCPDPEAEKKMKQRIDEAISRGDTVGGVFELRAIGVPPGLGSYSQWDLRLDGHLAQALVSIPAIKAVELGMGFEASRKWGSEIHDEIFYRDSGKTRQGYKEGFYRMTNNAGGIEGGVSNGEDIVLRAAMKPISTLRSPLRSVDIETKKKAEAGIERADVCAVPAAAVVGEAITAIEITRAFQEKFGGDSLEEVKRNYQGYREYLQ